MHAFAVDPGLAILPVHVIAQQHLVELVNVRLVGEHDVAGVIESEAIDIDRAAPPADTAVLLQQKRVLAEVISGAQSGRTRAHYNHRPRRTAGAPGRSAGAGAGLIPDDLHDLLLH